MARSWLDRLLTTRRALRDLSRIATALEQQTVLLTRLADKFAPLIPAEDEQATQSATISYTRDVEQARIFDFAARVQHDTGRAPTDDEIVRFLEGEPV